MRPLSFFIVSPIIILLVSYPLAPEKFEKRTEPNRNKLAGGYGGVPNYSNLFYWAAHPAKHDNSDSIPSFLNKEVRDTSVDVFFLHPTTYTKNATSAPLNADVDDTAVNTATDREV